MVNRFVQLKPEFILEENWKPLGPIIFDSLLGAPSTKVWYKDVAFARVATLEKEKDWFRKWISWIQSVRIEIAEASQSRKIGSDKRYDYLESEIGMNIVVPKGHIEEMRIYAKLLATHKVVAIDGFPKDFINQKYIIEGKVKVAINKAFKFVPVLGSLLGELLEIDLNPWEFKIGSLKRVNVDFSGGLTSTPEWYFRKNGIRNDLRLALIIRKPKLVKRIKAEVKAAWLYNPSGLKKTKIGTGATTVKIY